MIAPMTKYSFILLSGQQDGFLETLQDIGLVDITRSVKPVDEKSASILSRAAAMKETISALGYADTADAQPVPLDGDPASAGRHALSELSAALDRKAALEKEAARRRPWGQFNPEALDALTSLGYKIRYYSVATKQFNPAWAEKYPLQVVSEEGGKTFFVTIVPPGEEGYFLPADEVEAPGGSYLESEAEIAGTDEKIALERGRILSARERIPEISAMYDQALSELDLYLAGAASVPAADDTLVTFVGYAPTESDLTVTEALDKTGAFYLKEAATKEDRPPIKFRNSRFVKMFEVLTDMYGRPAYDGFDPTPFIAVFFLLFFAFCMGDAGYGLILILAGLAMKKMKSLSSMSPLVVTLGVGTTVIGFLFHTFFSMDIAGWSIFQPIKWIFLPSKIMGYDGTMVLAIIVGIVHLSIAMIMKGLTETRQKGFVNCLGTWGWTLLFVGGVCVAGLALTGVLDKSLTKWTIIVIGVLSAIGIFLLNNVHRNPLINIGSGLWDTYNTVTGLLGDVLSYLRLYALGLAGAMLGKAFNDIGLMVLGDGSNFVMWIPFILIVLVGHTLNIAMCVLGAFVHPLRLNFLEFFKNSGYEAAGRSYKPLKK